MEHLRPITKAAVLDQAARTDAAAIADFRAAAEVALGFHQHITAEAGALAEGAAGRIGEAHALGHPVAPQPLLQRGLALGELQAVVDAVDLVRVGHLQVHGLAEHRHGVGQVKLALVVVGGELRQHRRQLPPVEAVDAGIGKGVAALLLAAVAVLHDAAYSPLLIGEDPTVASWIGQAGREQGHGGAAGAVLRQQLLQGAGTQQGHIAVEHQQLALEAGEGLEQLLHGVAGAVLGLLQHEFQAPQGSQGTLHPLGLVAHDQ